MQCGGFEWRVPDVQELVRYLFEGSFPYLSLTGCSYVRFLVACLRSNWRDSYSLDIFSDRGYQLFKNLYKTFENSWNASRSLSTEISFFF